MHKLHYDVSLVGSDQAFNWVCVRGYGDKNLKDKNSELNEYKTKQQRWINQFSNMFGSVVNTFNDKGDKNKDDGSNDNNGKKTNNIQSSL